MENGVWMEWVDEDFGKGEKYTEEFTSSGGVEGWESTSLGVPSWILGCVQQTRESRYF